MSYREPYNPFGGGFSYMPPVIKILLFINIAVYLVFNVLFDNTELNAYFQYYGALHGSASRAEFYPWQLITYMFMHGGFSHIAFNMLALWMFGVEIENYWGSNRFLTYYMITGIGAGLCQIFLFPESSVVGASGAVYGVLLAFGMMFPDRIIFVSLIVPMKAKYFVLLYGAIELISGLTRSGNIAHFAHLGGMLFGYLLIKYWQKGGDFSRVWKNFIRSMNTPKPSPNNGGAKIYDYQQYTQSTSGSSQAKTDAQKLDEILDKIADKGYAGLTKEEKDFLFAYSKRK